MSAASFPQKNRITGGLVDRNQPLGFRFYGQHYTGFAGDTLASALLANNVRLVGRSFKYHRPRGILTAGSEEPNALMTIGNGAHQDPNSRATTAQLFDGMSAKSQTKMGLLSFDLMQPSFDLTGFGAVPCLTKAAQARSRTFINQEPKDEHQQQ